MSIYSIQQGKTDIFFIIKMITKTTECIFNLVFLIRFLIKIKSDICSSAIFPLEPRFRYHFQPTCGRGRPRHVHRRDHLHHGRVLFSQRHSVLLRQVEERLHNFRVLVVVLPQQDWLHDLLVEPPVEVADLKDADAGAEDVLDAGGGHVHHAVVQPLVHGQLDLRLRLDLEELDEGLDGDALYEHGPEHDGQRGCDEHGCVGDLLLVDEKHQSEGDGAP